MAKLPFDCLSRSNFPGKFNPTAPSDMFMKLEDDPKNMRISNKEMVE
jgi:hypothetical protein